MTFVFYMNVIYEGIGSSEFYDMMNYILVPVQLVFALYFLLNEIKQFKA
jgi:hypothetical protein